MRSMKELLDDENVFEWRRYLKKRREGIHWTWDQCLMLGKETSEQTMAFIHDKERFDPLDYYTRFESFDEWKALVDYFHEEEQHIVEASDPPQSERSGFRKAEKLSEAGLWEAYKREMLKNGTLPRSAVQNIEVNAEAILNHLYDDNMDQQAPFYGLVMGNVQSGKTSNMEALMAMAADCGWNMFIVLTGTIENLRQQTETRMYNDLKNGSLFWDFIPLSDSGYGSPGTLDLSEESKSRYVITCLKNTHRLKTLIQWLNKVPSKKKQMKVLVIDDEADQAGLNTNKMEDGLTEDGLTEEEALKAEDERARINREIIAIVTGRDSIDTEQAMRTPYACMNYICYTATPYGNLLNEAGGLYPRNYIRVLPLAKNYFGPMQIFGDPTPEHQYDGLPIINLIPNQIDDPEHNDVRIIEDIKEVFIEYDQGNNQHKRLVLPDLPKTLKDAICWFCVAVAIRRKQLENDSPEKIRPLSMMIHHSMKTVYHRSLYRAISQWLTELSMEDYIQYCRNVYDEQTKKLSRNIFVQSWPDYGADYGAELPQDIPDYPSFENIRDYLGELKKQNPSMIKMNDAGQVVYTKGLHICVDNSQAASLIPDGAQEKYQARLSYPAEGSICPTNVPAFIVIGGNTLSRGLTLEGLVSTYFSRSVGQADTLMQMGRWFGYRVGYELLPRIWMTNETVNKFEEMTEMDVMLRNDITERYYEDDIKPIDIGPIIRAMPGLHITSKRKMQGAVEVEPSFEGKNLQTFIFENNTEKLAANLKKADEFLTALGKPQMTTPKVKIWSGVPFHRIREELLEGSVYRLTSQATTEEICDWFSRKTSEMGFTDWEVILSGTASAERQWHGVGLVERSRMLVNGYEAGGREISLGTLGDPGIWRADISKEDIEKLSPEDRDLLRRAESGSKKTEDKVFPDEKRRVRDIKEKVRHDAGKDRTPRLVIYCIDKNSKPRNAGSNRAPLATETDVIGLQLLIPGRKRMAGQKINTGYQLK